MERLTTGMAKKEAVKRKTAGAGASRPAAVKRKAAAPKLTKEVTAVVGAALDRKAEDLVVLDLRKSGGFTDFFLICTGANSRQIAAIADSIREVLKKEFDERPALAEGIDKSEWVLLDYFDFVVHIFSRECREFYGLERLWGNAERYGYNEDGSIRS